MNTYVLWLTSWYPGKTDPFNGDFIERQAKAVAAFTTIVIIFVTKDNSLKKGCFVIEKEVTRNLTVYRAYYGTSRFLFSEKIYSTYKYFFLQKNIFNQIRIEKGLPALVHVHISFKAGILARYIKSKFRIPYIITEHWSGYYKKSPNSIYKAGFFHKLLTKWILKGGAIVLPVARKLGEAVNQLISIKFKVVPNVVDSNLFFYKPSKLTKPRFIHPSTMNFVKNPEGILRAAIELHNEGYDFELLMVGGVKESIRELAEKSGGLNQYLFFKKEISYKQVAAGMQNSSALVLFSRFESMPCVILEALCCGLPVISTDVGGIKEVVNKTNGILVESEDEEALKNALKEMVENYHLFNREKIALDASATFAYSTIGRQIYDVYKQVLNKEKKPW